VSLNQSRKIFNLGIQLSPESNLRAYALIPNIYGLASSGELIVRTLFTGYLSNNTFGFFTSA